MKRHIFYLTMITTGLSMFFNWSKDFMEHGYGYVPFIILAVTCIMITMWILPLFFKHPSINPRESGEGRE